jgi:hypothetical protein
LPSPDGIVHHSFVSCLFLPLDGEKGIVANFGRRVSGTVCILKCHETVLPGALFQLFVFCAFDEIVDASLAQKIRLSLFACADLAISRSLVHPVNSVYPLFAASLLELPLQLLLRALLLDFIDA